MEISKAFRALLARNPFYGLFLLKLNKEVVPEDHSVKTLTVSSSGINFTLHINEGYWKTLTDKQCIALLTHELMHLCLFHLTDSFDAENKYVMNIAMDCEINQLIQDLPEDGIFIDKLEKMFNITLPRKAGSWTYYKELIKVIDPNNQMGQEKNSNGGGSGSNSKQDSDSSALERVQEQHSKWPKDVSEAEVTLMKNQLKTMVKETAEEVVKTAGVVPGEIKEILEKIKDAPPVFNWKRYFRRLLGNSITTEITTTRYKPSKRFPDAKGLKLITKPTVLVAVDTSGSISNNDLIDFFAEIKHIYKSGVQVTVAEFDTQIQKVFEFKGTQNIVIAGRGGTNATCVINYFKENRNKYTTLVIFTDGYLSTFNLPKCNPIWIITHNGNKNEKLYPGKTVFIPNQ